MCLLKKPRNIHHGFWEAVDGDGILQRALITHPTPKPLDILIPKPGLHQTQLLPPVLDSAGIVPGSVLPADIQTITTPGSTHTLWWSKFHWSFNHVFFRCVIVIPPMMRFKFKVTPHCDFIHQFSSSPQHVLGAVNSDII